jgi:hypothetical protein
MRPIDMSAAAVTARLRLVSELRRLCISLASAKAKEKPAAPAQGDQTEIGEAKNPKRSK